MRVDRYVLLGLAPARQSWFTTVAHWSHTGTIAADFVKCQSAEEVRVRLSSDQVFSALLVDAGSSGLDRDLIDRCRQAGSAVLVVGEMRGRIDWRLLGVDAVLSGSFERGELLDALARHAVTVGDPTIVTTLSAGGAAAPTHRAKVVAVCGPGGTGASTVAVAIAQGLASLGTAGPVLLADLCLDAEQAMLHDAGDLGPGLQELVEAHRAGATDPADARRSTHAVPTRGYDLLLGLRRSRGWAAIRPRAFEAAFETVRATWASVVVDTDAVVEGAAQGGSLDVEERHVMARTALAEADVVVVVGAPGLKGLHSLLRVIADLLAFGVAPGALLVVLNRIPRPGRRTADSAVRTLVDLLPPDVAGDGPVALAERRIESAFIDGARLPEAFVAPLRAAVATRLRAPTAEPRASTVAVEPGELGRWAAADMGATR